VEGNPAAYYAPALEPHHLGDFRLEGFDGNAAHASAQDVVLDDANRAEKLFLSAWAAASPDAGINAREEKTTSAAELQCFFADFSARAEALACPSSGAIGSLYRS